MASVAKMTGAKMASGGKYNSLINNEGMEMTASKTPRDSREKEELEGQERARPHHDDPEATASEGGEEGGTECGAPGCLWGWVVTFAAFVLICVAMIPYTSFGILFSGFLLELGTTQTTITYIFNLTLVSSSVFSYLVGPLLEEFDCRWIAFASNLALSLGLGVSALAPSAEFLFFSCSLLMGMNIDVLQNLSYLIIPHYFTKRYHLANSLMTCGVCVTQMVMPPLTTYLQGHFGSRAATLGVAAISLNGCAAAMVMQPVEWHRRNFHRGVARVQEPPAKKKTQNLSELLLRMVECAKRNVEHTKSPTLLIVSSVAALNSVCFFNIFNLVPFAMRSRGYTTEETTTCLSVLGAMNLCSRLLTAFHRQGSRVKMKWMYMAGTTVAATGTLVFSLKEGVAWKTVSLGVVGLGYGTLMSSFNLVILEQLGMTKHLPTLCLSSLFKGFWYIIIGSLLALLWDLTGSYFCSLFLLTTMLFFSVLLWLLLPAAKSFERRRKAAKTPQRHQHALKKTPTATRDIERNFLLDDLDLSGALRYSDYASIKH